jgi:hypothetical protein
MNMMISYQELVRTFLSPILEGRSEEDLLTELMLKRGIDLSVNIETRQFDGLTVSVLTVANCLPALTCPTIRYNAQLVTSESSFSE